MTDKIFIFDTTLRDGEQSPGCTMNVEEKLMIAEVLDDMKVDIIEAGFAISSNGDFQAVNEIAKRAKHAAVCSLARAIHKDIDRAGEAVKPAKHPRIHTFMSTSDIHLKYQFRKTREQAIEIIDDTVRRARNLCADVEWSAMDATRTELDFLCKAVETAIKAGATTINLPDTVGYSIPSEIYHIFSTVMNKVPNSDKAIFSFHGQNDLGMAVGNAIAAIQAGARQIECTINGIGERAGNTSLEEVVMTLKTRKDLLNYKCDVKSEYIMRASKMIVNVTGLHVQANKAIVGANAFAHESGIHQDGVLKHAETYEIMKPESIGLTKNKLVMGKHSGRAAFKDKLKDLNLHVEDAAIDGLFQQFKDLADKKKEVFDDDIIALVDDSARESREDRVQFKSMDVHCGTKGPQKAEVCCFVDGVEKCVETSGQGPIDAIYKAIREITGSDAELQLYDVTAVTEGIDSQAEVSVRLRGKNGVVVTGTDSDIDTTVASAKAYINALNKLVNYEERISLVSEEVA
jgi:2-isopropylmalate synthase